MWKQYICTVVTGPLTAVGDLLRHFGKIAFPMLFDSIVQCTLLRYLCFPDLFPHDRKLSIKVKIISYL